jgi:hypothetical protein
LTKAETRYKTSERNFDSQCNDLGYAVETYDESPGINFENKAQACGVKSCGASKFEVNDESNVCARTAY